MSSPAAVDLERRGALAYERIPKVSGEVFAITYGASVNLLLQESGGLSVSTSPATIEERCHEVNKRLFDMGRRIGHRLVDEFLAKVDGLPPCKTLEQTIETLVLVALRMFLGLAARVRRVDERSPDALSVTFDMNPLNGFAALPEAAKPFLWYSNVLCGAICGAVDIVNNTGNIKCCATFVKCVLRGDATHEILVTRGK